MSTSIAIVTYESRHAPSGGIAAVISHLPAAIREAARQRVVVLTPYHWRIKRTVDLPADHFGRTKVRFLGADLAVDIRRHVDQSGVEWFLLAPQDQDLFIKAEERFFAGFPHPYRTPEPVLVRDSLLLGAAVAAALPAIDPLCHWTVLAQDWEGATAALAFAGAGVHRHRVYLTMHNSYDSGGVDPQALRDVGIDPSACAPVEPGARPTVLERALGCVEHPIFTVSGHFAAELLGDVLQAEVMAPHLRPQLAGRLVGVDNGPFVDLAVDQRALLAAQSGDHAPLAYWKQRRREAFLTALSRHVPDERRPLWGDLAAFTSEAEAGAPSFVLAGRDDPRQRGHDVAARAIDDFLAGGGRAQFIFLPIPGDEGLRGLRFLQRLADRHPREVLILPFIFREGFFAALEGAAFGVMPSLYEPFGGANEFYLRGTVAIARATGGLVQQIIPYGAAAACSTAVRLRAARWHALSSQPTGILYREPDAAGTLSRWRDLNAGGYDPTGQSPDRDRPTHRSQNPLFAAMTRGLRTAIEDGVRLWSEAPDRYYQMLVEGIDYIQRTYSWRRAAQEYVRVCGLGTDSV